MSSGYRYIVADSHVTRSVAPDLKSCLIFCIQNEEDFRLRELLFVVVGAQSLQDDEVVLGLFYLDDVHDSVVNVDGERKLLLAQLTVDLLVLEHDVAFDRLHIFVLLKPLT